MKLARFSVHRPIFTVMATLVVVLLGAISLSRLPVDLMPDITYPTLTISTIYENASPEEIEDLITRPIEEAVSAVPGVEEFTSTSSEGSSDVSVKFGWGRDLDAAANDIRDRLDRVIPNLPNEAERPMLRKYDLAAFPVLILGASSNLDPLQMRKIIDDQVVYRIERLPGVASMDVSGGLTREIQVNLEPVKIKSLGLSLNLIIDRIKAGNINLPAGLIERGSREIMIRTPGEFTSVDELRNLVIAVKDGAAIRLKDIASVEDTAQRVRRLVRVNGEGGVRLLVRKQSGTNTVEVVDSVLKELERIKSDLPQIRIVPIIDTSDYIKRSISNLGNSAAHGGLLSVIILLLFLRNIRSTAVITLSIPISIISTFVLMYFGGFTLNLMTLGGLALGVGRLVDDSIVVLENIYRLRETGQSPEEAAVNGTEEVTPAIVSSTLTMVVVFLPLVFMQGMQGVMFRQMAVVISFSLMCSLAVALTLVPMLAAKILTAAVHAATPAKETIGHKIFRVSGRAFVWMENTYRRMLDWSLNHRLAVAGGSAALLLGSLALVPLVGTEMMPATDEGEVRVYAEMEVGTRLPVFDAQMQRIEEIIRQAVPEIKSLITYSGGWGANSGEVRISLKPQSQRKRSSEAITADLRKRLVNLPGLVIRVRVSQSMISRRMGLATDDNVAVEVRGHDLAAADALAKQVAEIMRKVNGATDVRVSRELSSLEELILVDRAKAADMKLTILQVANSLQTILGGTQAGYFRDQGTESRIMVRLKDSERQQLADVMDLKLTNADDQQVSLRNVVKVESRHGPMNIQRKDQERIVVVSGNFSGRDTGSVLADLGRDLKSVPLPRDFSIDFGGDYDEQQKAFRELLVSLILSLVLVYMVMACQYESLRDPFVVMFSVPLAAIGVILILFFTDTTFNIQSYIGCIMLGGIVVNNAILLVDHTNLLRRRDGMGLRAAIEEAGRRRLRPILMTALTTILGLLPLAIGLGEGGEAQAPLARAVIGGLTSSTLITLVLVPVIYSMVERKEKMGGGPQGAPGGKKA